MSWPDLVASVHDAGRGEFAESGIYEGDSGGVEIALVFEESPLLVDVGGGVSVESKTPRLLGVPEEMLPDGRAKRGHRWLFGGKVYRVVERLAAGPGHVDLRLEKVT